ncbi:hypothetical protein L596_025614 [Steinernema carpocapsae]|uniref:Uncharacterized protein n=1 Tax=Steinernema carpocapsae TaxID=34508 RepID=A0A4U5M893_STECR|nr:hypothetical protein L596_025614 [Steinernema carpocapsae]
MFPNLFPLANLSEVSLLLRGFRTLFHVQSLPNPILFISTLFRSILSRHGRAEDELASVETSREELAREARIKWTRWQLEQAECEHRAIEWKAYWDWRKKEDKDLWRNKDFANAVDKMSRAGYKGEHGEFEVPEEDKVKLMALYMQATVGRLRWKRETRLR